GGQRRLQRGVRAPHAGAAAGRDGGAAGRRGGRAGEREGPPGREPRRHRAGRGHRLLGGGAGGQDVRSSGGRRGTGGGRGRSPAPAPTAAKRSAKGAPPARTARGRVLGGEQVEGRQAVRELLLAGRRKVRELWVATDVED